VGIISARSTSSLRSEPAHHPFRDVQYDIAGRYHDADAIHRLLPPSTPPIAPSLDAAYRLTAACVLVAVAVPAERVVLIWQVVTRLIALPERLERPADHSAVRRESPNPSSATTRPQTLLTYACKPPPDRQSDSSLRFSISGPRPRPRPPVRLLPWYGGLAKGTPSA
jgi:hypothetical protein